MLQAWSFHQYITYTTNAGQSKILCYGEPEDLEGFCIRAQVVNYAQYKALVEAWGSSMWEKYTGLLIWKTQNPWTGLRGQLYDWYLNVTGGYFGVKQCCGDMVHVQCNPAKGNTIEIVNLLPEALDPGGKIEVRLPFSRK